MSFLFTTISYSQSLKSNDTNIVFLSEAENIYYTPSGLITSINFSVVKFESKQAGIQFILTTKRAGKESVIGVDSIILQSGSKQLTISSPYNDTVYLRNEGGLLFSLTHFLNQKEMRFLKEEPITNMVLIVNRQHLIINIKKKSQIKIYKIANTYY